MSASRFFFGGFLAFNGFDVSPLLGQNLAVQYDQPSSAAGQDKDRMFFRMMFMTC